MRNMAIKSLSRYAIITVNITVYYRSQAPQILCKEAIMWKRLNHPNILPLLWITLDPLQLISEWMPGGELPQYIKERPHASRIGLVGTFVSLIDRRSEPRYQLSDIANGLFYLHSCNIIHGDLKGVRDLP